MRTKILTCIALILTSLSLTAQEYSIDTLGVKVYFHQGSSTLDMNYKYNGVALQSFISNINNLQKSTSTGINYISIETAASPEGTFESNEKLAMNRAKTIRQYLANNLAVNASQIRTYSMGENWEGFANYILTSNCPWKAEIQAILTKYNVKTTVDRETSYGCKSELMSIDNGKAWKWLIDNVFTDLRNAAGDIICVMNAPSAPQIISSKDTVVIIHEYEANKYLNDTYIDSLASLTVKDALVKRDVAEKRKHAFKKDSLFRQPVLAFRTNLFVPLTNIGIEIPTSNRWSLEADYYTPWVRREWMNMVFPYYENCFQVQMIYLCERYWFGNLHSNKDGDPLYRLRGNSIAFGVGTFHYDIGFNSKGQQGNGAGVGIDYMYSRPLGKGGVHLEFNLGVCGYYRTYRNYKIENNTYDANGNLVRSDILIGDGDRKNEIFVAPFKCGFSLTVPIFKKTSKVSE